MELRQLPQVGLTLVDGSDSRGQFGLWLRANTSVSAGRAAVAALLGLLPTSLASVERRVIYPVIELDPAAGAGDSTQCAVFVFETTAAGQLAVIAVPGLRPHLVDPAAPHLVNLAAAPVQALIAALQTGIWCNPFGYSLTNCIAALVEKRNP